MPDAPVSKGRAAGGRRSTRVLVIGCGFIGSHVVAQLADLARPPVVLTHSRPRSDEIAAAIEPGDLRIGDAAKASDLEAALDGIGHVVYTAGGLLPAASEKNPERDRQLTLAPLQAVLEALRERPGTKLTYISSGGTVYGQPEQLPVPETAPTHPRGSYGELHLACEEEIERHCDEHGLWARILRCSTVYGEHQQPDRGQGAVPTFLHRIEHEAQIDLYGDGSTVRDYIYAGDVARVTIELLEREDGPRKLNVGAGEGTSLIDVLELAQKQVGREAIVKELPERDFDVHQIYLDISRLRELTGFEPTPLQAGIAHTHRWLTETAPERV